MKIDDKMEKCTVIVSSAGRRVELVCWIRASLERRGVYVKIITCDINPTAPAHYFSDFNEIVPSALDADYADHIISLLKKYEADILIPTIDPELLPLSLRRDDLMKVSLCNLSPAKTVRICRAKGETTAFLRDTGLLVPDVYASVDEAVFPAFIKPLDGSSSVQAYRADNIDSLCFYAEQIKNPIIQKFIAGKEYSVDVFSDFSANVITVVPRLRIATRGGEIQRGRIEKNTDIMKVVRRAAEGLGLTGHTTFQCIQNETGVYFIEVNPRFGGGAPMSMRAGADSIQYLYDLRRGKTLAYNEDFLDGIECSRFDDAVYFDASGKRVLI